MIAKRVDKENSGWRRLLCDDRERFEHARNVQAVCDFSRSRLESAPSVPPAHCACSGLKADFRHLVVALIARVIFVAIGRPEVRNSDRAILAPAPKSELRVHAVGSP